MIALKYLGVVAVVIVLVGVAAYLPTLIAPSSGGTSSTSSTATSTTLATSMTTLSTTTSSTQGGSIQADSYSYDPRSPVKVLSVYATTTSGSQGTSVAFYVTYENIGSKDIYYITGCGSSLDANVTSGSGVIQTTSGGPVCLCAEAIATLPPNGNHTALTPGCWSRYHFMLVGTGTAQAKFTIYWGSTQGSQQNDTTTVTASFTFS